MNVTDSTLQAPPTAPGHADSLTPTFGFHANLHTLPHPPRRAPLDHSQLIMCPAEQNWDCG